VAPRIGGDVGAIGCGPSLLLSLPRHQLPEAVGASLVGSVIGVLDQTQRQFGGASALWLGEWPF